MLKVSEAVNDIVYSSEIILITLSQGLLNLSAYAQSIKKEVEEKTKKEVTTGSIIIALSRLEKSLGTQSPIVPEFKIDDLTMKSPLIEITFEKTNENIAKLKDVYMEELFNTQSFLTTTQSSSEITIVASEESEEKILKIYKHSKPKTVIKNLVALSVKFSEKYIDEPNIIYALVRSLAMKRINIIEIISTYTELTFIIDKNQLEEAFITLNKIFQRK